MASPFLMLPTVFDDDDHEEIHSLSLYSLKNEKPDTLNFVQNLRNMKWIGSSHGWLAFLDGKDNPFLLNPFTKTQILLPPKQPKISKLILSQNPSSHPKTFAAVAVHDYLFSTNISFCRKGDTTWQSLNGQGKMTYDVVCCHKTNTLFALGPGPCVESWNLNEAIPTKTTVIDQPCPTLHLASQSFPSDLYSDNWYLALSPAGEIFMAVRYIGEFVRYDGEVVYEGDTLTDYMAEPLVCPYRTIAFRVFKAADSGRKWVDVDDLGNLAMFLGGNESVMVSSAAELKRNAIYFTDDYWLRIDEDYNYGGHDFGVFSLEDGRVETLFDFQTEKFDIPPFWITLPHHC